MSTANKRGEEEARSIMEVLNKKCVRFYKTNQEEVSMSFLSCLIRSLSATYFKDLLIDRMKANDVTQESMDKCVDKLKKEMNLAVNAILEMNPEDVPCEPGVVMRTVVDKDGEKIK